MKSNLYSTGEFAKKANVSVRTIHYYEKMGLIQPEKISDTGYRYYSEKEFARIQRILTLKLLGFSLEEIQVMSLNETNTGYLQKSFDLQLSLVRRKIQHLKAVEESVENVSHKLKDGESPDWDEITKLIQIINMDRELVEQYKNEKNLDARCTLHTKYSHNTTSWFSWIFSQVQFEDKKDIVEIGCGNGMLWYENASRIPANARVLLTDVSPGMLEDSKKNLREVKKGSFSYQNMDANNINLFDQSFDYVVANFVLFYLRDLQDTLTEINRILRPNGTFVCATYGQEHMKEVEQLVKEFNPKISLSPVHLYEKFGLDNGKKQLSKYFREIKRIDYPDYLMVTDVEPFVEYVMSCHGNQKEYLLPKYEEFKAFVKRKMDAKGYLKITKQAGLFICQK